MLELDFFSLLLLGLASFRLTRLIVFDAITEKIRAFFLKEVVQENGQEGEEIYLVPRGSGVRKFIGELISCFWCTGIWTSGLLIVLYSLLPSVGIWVLAILSVAAIASLLEMLVQKLY